MIVAAYLLSIVAANLLISKIGAGWTPVVGFFAIGLDLTLRDKLHERWSGRRLLLKMAALIAVGGVATVILSSGSLAVAVASLLAFTAASSVDAGVYHALRGSGKPRARYVSNIFGAAADSMVFPFMAFGTWMPAVILLQFAAKAAGGTMWAWVLNMRER